MRLLVADDDFTSRQILQAVLMKCGYEGDKKSLFDGF
jgi:hypothetical protein